MAPLEHLWSGANSRKTAVAHRITETVVVWRREEGDHGIAMLGVSESCANNMACENSLIGHICGEDNKCNRVKSLLSVIYASVRQSVDVRKIKTVNIHLLETYAY